MFKAKCKYADICPHYQEGSFTCRYGGGYCGQFSHLTNLEIKIRNKSKEAA